MKLRPRDSELNSQGCNDGRESSGAGFLSDHRFGGIAQGFRSGGQSLIRRDLGVVSCRLDAAD
jgi:hypothetical protein